MDTTGISNMLINFQEIESASLTLGLFSNNKRVSQQDQRVKAPVSRPHSKVDFVGISQRNFDSFVIPSGERVQGRSQLNRSMVVGGQGFSGMRSRREQAQMTELEPERTEGTKASY